MPENFGATERGPADAVLLIDGDNDPHVPPDFRITPWTIIRVFLRPGVKMPASLERRVGSSPLCVSVSSPKGGANAADFVMSLHAGILHATLPMQIPFTLVTADASLAVMAQELQRLGRQAALWTSHVATSPRPPRRKPAGQARPAPRRRAAPQQAAQQPAQQPAQTISLTSVAGAYAARLSRMKDPPSRLKALLNDIKNRAGAGGFPPESILEALKQSHGLMVDENGKVQRGKPA